MSADEARPSGSCPRAQSSGLALWKRASHEQRSSWRWGRGAVQALCQVPFTCVLGCIAQEPGASHLAWCLSTGCHNTMADLGPSAQKLTSHSSGGQESEVQGLGRLFFLALREPGSLFCVHVAESEFWCLLLFCKPDYLPKLSSWCAFA